MFVSTGQAGGAGRLRAAWETNARKEGGLVCLVFDGGIYCGSASIEYGLNASSEQGKRDPRAVKLRDHNMHMIEL